MVILLSGRPLIVTEHLPQWDAFVVAWLPGTEGYGVAKVLFGDYPFTDKLSFTWLLSMARIPLSALADHDSEPPFPLGFRLSL